MQRNWKSLVTVFVAFVCTVLYVFTVCECVCVSRVACVCVLGLDDSHRFMNCSWSMLVHTVCLHLEYYVSPCKCDCVYFSVNVCVYLLWPVMFFFLQKKKGGEIKAVPQPGSPPLRRPGIPRSPWLRADLEVWHRGTLCTGQVCVCVSKFQWASHWLAWLSAYWCTS